MTLTGSLTCSSLAKASREWRGTFATNSHCPSSSPAFSSAALIFFSSCTSISNSTVPVGLSPAPLNLPAFGPRMYVWSRRTVAARVAVAVRDDHDRLQIAVVLQLGRGIRGAADVRARYQLLDEILRFLPGNRLLVFRHVGGEDEVDIGLVRLEPRRQLRLGQR